MDLTNRTLFPIKTLIQITKVWCVRGRGVIFIIGFDASSLNKHKNLVRLFAGNCILYQPCHPSMTHCCYTIPVEQYIQPSTFISTCESHCQQIFIPFFS